MRDMLLVQEDMLPIPDRITVLSDFGFVGIVDTETGKPLAHGTHMHLEGPEATFAAWLQKFDTVWRTVPGTSPVMQQFESVHVRDEVT